MSESVGSSAPLQSGMNALAGKYLTFELAHEVYGLQILKVQEIIGMMNVTKVPRTPGFVRGVINLRGKVIPVVELRSKFEMTPTEDNDRTCIIVVQVQHENEQVIMGLIVDEVSEVVDIAASQLEPPPTFGTSVDTSFILAMGKVSERVVILLGVDQVLSTTELRSLSAGAAQG